MPVAASIFCGASGTGLSAVRRAWRVASQNLTLLLSAATVVPLFTAQAQWATNIVQVEEGGFFLRGNDRTLKRIEKTYAEMPPARYTPPPGRWKHLPLTAKCLRDGPVLRVVMLGDSIVVDTSHSGWDLLTQRRNPHCRIEKITSVRGSTGCWWYKENNRVKPFVLDHNPDLLIIGGISQREDIDSIREVIRQVRAGGCTADLLLMTGAFGEVDPRDDKQWQEQMDPSSKDYRARLRKLAEETGSAFLDMSAAWGRYIRDSGKDLVWFKRDAVHANERGEQILGRVLDRYLSLEETDAGRAPPSLLIGYTEYQTNQRGGRHANIATMRACVVNADGTNRRVLAEKLGREPDAWTQFTGWSPDGRIAMLGRGWEDPTNAAWEDEHKTFRMTQGWRYDIYFLDLNTGALTNITGVERVSDYSSGVFFWPGRSDRLGFTALLKGISHPFAMDLDGRNKQDLSGGGEGYSYGFSASPDGKLISYHKDYYIYIAEADGSHPRRIDTGNPFNFAPQWSSDGQWLLFVSGEHYDCHPYVVRRDGTGVKKVGDRGGHRGEVPILDVFDFHGGSSDVPAWSKDGRWIYYTAKVGESVELMRASLGGSKEQLTHSPPGALNYHPTPSPGGKWLIIGSTRTSTRQLYLMPVEGGELRPITHMAPGYGAMWPNWQPVAAARANRNSG